MNSLPSNRDPVIVAAVRTAIGKAKRGSLATVNPTDMGAAVIRELLGRTPSLNPVEIDDVIIGCAMPEGDQGLNMGRQVALHAGLPVSVAAETVNRFCSSGLQTIADASMRIMSGMAETVIAGGVESMSLVPMIGFNFVPNPGLAQNGWEVYMSMGLTAERVSEQYNVTRQDQDEFSLRSHQNAARAIQEGTFEGQIVPLDVTVTELDADEKPVTRSFTFKVDEGVRLDTSLEGLARLRPVFKEGGTVTAGNASQMSDGAAAVIVMSRAKAEALGLKPMARFLSFAVGGVPPEIMGIGPVVAIPKALKVAGLSLGDIGVIELNEAFAAQAVAVIRQAELDLDKVNVNGGAVALGHPLGCTGAKLTTQILYEMKRQGHEFGMVTMCVGGGMGAAGIFQNLN
ncbi:MAG TPA: acetyl-CoA C-acyltransferase [Anaerolineales bacterium]|nr:acetyl-CoA C-acyltransferase [Anaerolineales bacterium]